MGPIWFSYATAFCSIRSNTTNGLLCAIFASVRVLLELFLIAADFLQQVLHLVKSFSLCASYLRAPGAFLVATAPGQGPLHASANTAASTGS